jgi:hypothetical protein
MVNRRCGEAIGCHLRRKRSAGGGANLGVAVVIIRGRKMLGGSGGLSVW